MLVVAGGWCPRRPGRRLGVGRQRGAEACVPSPVAATCCAALGRSAVHLWGWSVCMQRLLSTSQPPVVSARPRCCGTVQCWDPRTPYRPLTTGSGSRAEHCTVLPMTATDWASAMEGLFIETRVEFSLPAGRFLPFFSSKAHNFSHYFTPSYAYPISGR